MIAFAADYTYEFSWINVDGNMTDDQLEFDK